MLCYLVFDKYFSVDEWVDKHNVLLFWQVKPVVHVFQVSVVSCKIAVFIPNVSVMEASLLI